MEPISLSASKIACLRNRQWLFKNISFVVKAGEVLYIKGPNGSGKSSLIRVLAGFLDPQEGMLYWAGEPIARIRSYFNTQILFIGHQNNLHPLLTPVENNRFAWGAQGRMVSEEASRAAFEQVGLPLASLYTPCYRLSAGQNKRVALARLVLSHASLWLLDEPFASLDEAGVYCIKNLMQHHVHKGGMIVYSSHGKLGKLGKLGELGEPGELFESNKVGELDEINERTRHVIQL